MRSRFYGVIGVYIITDTSCGIPSCCTHVVQEEFETKSYRRSEITKPSNPDIQMKIKPKIQKHHDSKALTLVEILVTLSVIGIILAIMLPMIRNVQTMREKEKLEHGQISDQGKTQK